MEVMHLSIVALLFTLTCCFATATNQPDDTDACTNARTLDVSSQLLHGQHETFTECNRNVGPGWYRPRANGVPAQIPNVCIKNNACNTQLPLRLDLGDRALPDVNVTIWASVCTSFDILGQWDCCVLRQRIGIRNCSGFYVYYMEPVDRCPVAYCFHEIHRSVPPEFTLKRGETVQSSNSDAAITVTPPQLQTTTNQNAAMSTTEPQNANRQTSATLASHTDVHTASGETTQSQRNEIGNVTIERESTPIQGNEFTALTTVGVQEQAESSATPIIVTDGATHGFNATEPSIQNDSGVTSTEATIVSVTSLITSSPSEVVNTTENATNTGYICTRCRLFRCTDHRGQEILITLRCNGDPDCPDGSDEMNCPNAGMCMEGMQRCPNSTVCYIRCDGTAQCSDRWDELGCPELPVPNENSTLPTSTPVTIFESTIANVTESKAHGTTSPDNATLPDGSGVVTDISSTPTAITFPTTVTGTSIVAEESSADVSTDSSGTRETSSSNGTTVTGASQTSTEHIYMTYMSSTLAATTVSVDDNVTMPTEYSTPISTSISIESATATENTTPTGNATSASTVDYNQVPSENVTSTEFIQFPSEVPTSATTGSTASRPRPMEITITRVADSTQIANETTTSNEIATPEIGATAVETTSSHTTTTVHVFETTTSSLPDSASETTVRASETTFSVALEPQLSTTAQEATTYNTQEITTNAFTAAEPHSTHTTPLTLSATRASAMPTVHAATEATSRSSGDATHARSTDSVQTTETTVITEIAGKPSEFHENRGLFVFLIVAGIIVVAIAVFGIIGYLCTRRMRRWEPTMAYQDAYADLEKSTLSSARDYRGIDSPIADIDILRDEQTEVEKISLSQASTLECSQPGDSPKSPERKQAKKLAISSNDVSAKESEHNNTSTIGKDEPKTAKHAGDDNSAYENDDVIDGVTPVDEIDNEFPGELFPWIEQAADTQL